LERTFTSRRERFKEQNISILLPGNNSQRSNNIISGRDYKMLSLRQLNHYIDSLENSFKRTESLYIKRHSNKGYYSAKVKQNNNSVDSIQIISTDSVFNTFNKIEKTFILKKALTLARDAKENIIDTKRRNE